MDKTNSRASMEPRLNMISAIVYRIVLSGDCLYVIKHIRNRKYMNYDVLCRKGSYHITSLLFSV